MSMNIRDLTPRHELLEVSAHIHMRTHLHGYKRQRQTGKTGFVVTTGATFKTNTQIETGFTTTRTPYHTIP